jgi:hypothetical protein
MYPQLLRRLCMEVDFFRQNATCHEDLCGQRAECEWILVPQTLRSRSSTTSPENTNAKEVHIQFYSSNIRMSAPNLPELNMSQVFAVKSVLQKPLSLIQVHNTEIILTNRALQVQERQ